MVVKEVSTITHQFVLYHGYGSSQDEQAESTAVIVSFFFSGYN